MRKFIALLVALAIALSMVGFTASSASAHHPVVSGVSVCDKTTGKFDITWTIKNSESHKMVYTSRLGGGEVLNTSDSDTKFENDVNAGTYNLEVKGTWPQNGVKETRTGSVTTQGTCVKDDVKDAVASVSTTPATCSKGETLVYGTIVQAVFSGTPNGTTGPANYAVTATANPGHRFASGSQVKEFNGSLDGKLTGKDCATQPPSEKVTENRKDCSGVDEREGTREYVWDGDSYELEPYDNISWGQWTHVRDLTDEEIIKLECSPPVCDDECKIPAFPTDAPKTTVCTGVIDDAVLNNVVIPKGKSCTLVDTYINGSVNTFKGRNLTMADVTVRGNVNVKHLTGDFVFGAKGSACRYDPMVGGSIVVNNSHNVLICEASVCKDVVLSGNDGRITVRESTARRFVVTDNNKFVKDGKAGHVRASVIRLIDVHGKVIAKGNAPRKVSRY